jgi:hypothetical protein
MEPPQPHQNQPFYVQAPPPAPPGSVKPRSTKTWLIAGGALIGGLLLGAAATGGAKTKTVASPAVTTTATATATATATTRITSTVTAHPTATVRVTTTFTPQPAVAFGDGVRVVGSDIQPGIYKTAGAGSCYWARMGDLAGSNINENGIVTGPTTVEVLASDKAFKTSGGCDWSRVS